MPNISPVIDSSNKRIDAGADWFRDYRWTVGGTAVDLAGYSAEVKFFYEHSATDGTCSLAFSATTGDGVEYLDAADGHLEIRIPKAKTEAIDLDGYTSRPMSFTVDLTRTAATDDAVSGYKTGETVRLVIGQLVAYRECAGK